MIGRMVRAGGSPPMKVMGIRDGVAKCILIDSEGKIRRRFHDVNQLSPVWLSLQPRSLWPEIRQIDIIAIEDEERAAQTSKREKLRMAKRVKRSNKIKPKAVSA